MKAYLIRPAVLGGIVFFIWELISWMVLPWHMATIHPVDHPETVASAVMENISAGSGTYAIPNFYYPGNRHVSEKQLQKDVNKGISRPLIFIAAHSKEMNPKGAGAFFGLIATYVVTAGLISYFIAQIGNIKYATKVFLVTLFGLTIGIMTFIPFSIWWGVSAGFVCVMILDLIIGWFLAGLLMMKMMIVPKKKHNFFS